MSSVVDKSDVTMIYVDNAFHKRYSYKTVTLGLDSIELLIFFRHSNYSDPIIQASTVYPNNLV